MIFLKDKRMQEEDYGGALPLVAIMIGVMLTFLAYLINGGLLSVAHDQSQHFARIATLAAIEEYYDKLECGTNGTTPVMCTPQERYEAALAKANEILTTNELLGSDATAETLLTPNDSNAPGTAKLIPGYWHTQKVNAGTASESDPACGAVPCFEAMSYPLQATYSLDNEHPNAFRITGDLFEKSPVHFGGNLLTQQNAGLRVESIASLVPRRGCFLVDISNSMIRETHTRWKYDFDEYNNWLDNPGNGYGPASDGVIGWGNEFSFYIHQCNHFPPGVPPNYPTWTLDPRCGTYYWMNEEKRNRGINAMVPTEHYQDDYRYKITLSDNDYPTYARKALHPNPSTPVPPNDPGTNYSISANNTPYFIDLAFINHRDPAYPGPQPLMSVFKGLQTAIKQLKGRKVAGDMLCVLFYDQSLKWPRVINITSDFDALLEYTRLDDLDDSGTPIHPSGIEHDHFFTQSAHLGADGNTPVGAELLIRHHLFPTAGSNTATVPALAEALRQLTYIREATKVPSSDFLILIGDGLSNCTTCPAGCATCSGSCVVSCDNSYDYYKESIKELHWYVDTNLVPSKIPAHVIMMGDVAPHTRFVYGIDSSGNNRCLTDKEAMRYGINPTHGGVRIGGSWIQNPSDAQFETSFSTAGSDNAFLQANEDMAYIAMKTGGIWAPLRPQVGSPGSCAQSRAPDSCGSGNSFQFNDPECRDAETQMIDAIKDILGDNPFQLVDVD